MFLSCGILVLYKRDLHELFALLSYDSRLIPSFYNIGYVLIGVGALIFIVGLLGCCGSVRESRVLLGLVSQCCKEIELAFLACLVCLLYHSGYGWRTGGSDVYGIPK